MKSFVLAPGLKTIRQLNARIRELKEAGINSGDEFEALVSHREYLYDNPRHYED